MGLIDKIKKRLAEREANDLKDGLQELRENAEKGRKNLDGSINLEDHDFRMPECMPIDVRVLDRIWKNDVEIFLETTYDTIKDMEKSDAELSDEVYELKKAFERLRKVEDSQRMKRLWKIIGGLICFLLEYDLAYRWRIKWTLDQMDLSTWDYTPEDAYWLNKRIDVEPPEVRWSEDEIEEWQKEEYGEVVWEGSEDSDED